MSSTGPDTSTFPPLPPQPTWDQQAQAARFAQSERSIAATTALAAAQNRSAAAMERTLADGIPTDQPMVDAINNLRTAIAGAPGGPGPTPAPEWLPELRTALAALLAALGRVQ
jgi:hypothetical protein